MHSWGKEDVDWKGIDDCHMWIGKQLKRWGRMNVMQTKEKWGLVCVYCNLGWSQLHSITHPGYAYSQYPQWLWTLDCLYFSKVFRYLNYLVIPYHCWLYTRVYGQALRKWPHLRAEILHGADCNELLQKYGVHTVKTGPNSYSIHYDWHPDNYVPKKSSDSEEIED